MIIYRFVTPDCAVASAALTALPKSTACVREAGLPAPAPAAKIIVEGCVLRIVAMRSGMLAVSRDWTIGCPPRERMEGIWDSERMRECTVWFSSVERMRVMCRATCGGRRGVLVDVCMYVCM